MLFDKLKDTLSAPANRSNLARTLLKPNFGASIRPIGESTRIFVNLIAMLFAMNGLFPKDHPAFLPDSPVRLTLLGVIETAWGNVRFDKQGMPHALFFLAAVGCMVVTTLAVIIGFLSLFVGQAHAASAFFTPPPQDLAQNWIDYLFKGAPLSADYTQGGATPPQTWSVQCAMQTALGFYSDAVLMIAALILFYHLSWMVVETAHHGQVMGKRGNQIWAPIRLVVAVGLLVPIGGTSMPNCGGGSGTGLNSAQYITIKIAELGSALASNTWIQFIKAMAATPYNLLPPSIPVLDNVVGGIFTSEACRAIWNYYIDRTDQEIGVVNATSSIPDPTGAPKDNKDGVLRYDYSGPSPDLVNACGAIILPSQAKTPTADPNLEKTIQPNDIAATISTAQIAAAKASIARVHKLFADLPPAGAVGPGSAPANDAAYFVPEWNNMANADNPLKNNVDFPTEIQTYAVDLQNQINNAVQGKQVDISQELITTNAGWIAAGSWMNVISRNQGSIIDATNDGVPHVIPPTYGLIDGEPQGGTQYAMGQFKEWMERGFAPGTQTITPCATPGNSGMAGQGDEDEFGSSPMAGVFTIIDKLAVNQGLWSGNDQNFGTACPVGTNPFALGKQFTSPNPLGELTAFGHKAINLAMKSADIMIYGIAAQMAGSFIAGVGTEAAKADAEAVQKEANRRLDGKLQKLAAGAAIGGEMLKIVGAVATTVFGFLALIFLTIGVTLAFIVPLIPFMHFFFGAIAWGVVLLEGIIAMPLVALAHLNPEGDGLPSGMAKQAYFMLLGLFMRPVMMIFGLVASLLIFFLSTMLLNKLFAISIIGTGGLSIGYTTFIRIVYTVIYVFLVYTCANASFKLIDTIPEAVFRWINVSVQHQRIADAGSALQSAGPLVTGVAGQQAMSAAQTLGQQGGAGAGALGGALGRGIGTGKATTNAIGPG